MVVWVVGLGWELVILEAVDVLITIVDGRNPAPPGMYKTL